MSISNPVSSAALPLLSASNFGAISGQDATAALNVAAQSIPISGGTLELQAGAIYYLSSSLNLKSNTILEGNGATLIDDVPVSENSAGIPLIDNVDFNATTIIDHNITVKDLNLDYAYVNGGGSHAINFREASNIDVDSVVFHGGNDATAFESTYDTIVNNCTAYNISNAAYDNWEGASDATVSNSTAYLTGSGSYGILFTGVGTSSGDQRTASGDTAFNDTIYNAGQAGIWVCALGADSAVDNVSLVDNTVYGGTNEGAGIGVSGAGTNILLVGNIISSIDGNNAIFVRSGEGNTPTNAVVKGNTLTGVTTPDASVAAIQALGNNITIADNTSIGGNYPSLIWAAGTNAIISNNTGANSGINTNGATNPQILTGGGSNIPFGLEMFGGAVDDTAAVGTIIGYVAAMDTNPSAVMTYSLIGSSNGMFTIDPNEGTIRLAEAAVLSASSSPFEILNVGVATSDGAGIEASFVVTVLPAAEADAGEVSYETGSGSSTTLTISGPIGQAILVFDTSGQLTQATDALGAVTSFTYAPGGQLELAGGVKTSPLLEGATVGIPVPAAPITTTTTPTTTDPTTTDSTAADPTTTDPTTPTPSKTPAAATSATTPAAPTPTSVVLNVQDPIFTAGTWQGSFNVQGAGDADSVAVSGVGYAQSELSGNAVSFSVAISGTTIAGSNVGQISFIDGTVNYNTGSTGAQVARLYEAALGRAHDPVGLASWTQALNTGTPLVTIAAGFIGSTEFQALYPGSSNPTTFVTQLYANVLHRAPDAGGLTNWVNALISGQQTQASVLASFSESAENQANTSSLNTSGLYVPSEDAAEVARLYYATLDRAPDVGGLTGWTTPLENNTLTLQQVATGFISSPEFVANYGSLTNTGFVNLLYQNVLGRAPDPTGQTDWVNALNTGALTRAGVVLGFSNSAENVTNMAPVIENNGIRFD